MYKRSTDRARKVLLLASEETLNANHEFVGTEDLLVGLAAEGSGVAANVLKSLGADLATIRIETQKQKERDPLGATDPQAIENDHFKTVIENARRAAHQNPKDDRPEKQRHQLPVGKQFQLVIEHSMQEAHALGHNYMGTEHLLLGLLREPEGIAAKVLSKNLRLKLEDVRQKVLNLLGHGLTPEMGD